MRNPALNSAFIVQTKLRNSKLRDWKVFEVSAALAFTGGLFLLMFAFVLFAIFTLLGGVYSMLNYAGVISIAVAFACLGLGAHLLDMADKVKRQQKRAKKY